MTRQRHLPGPQPASQTWAAMSVAREHPWEAPLGGFRGAKPEKEI